MQTASFNPQPQLLKSLVAARRLAEPFTLLDVGASGGISDVWYCFGDNLVAYGFDPLLSEVERLNAAKPPIGKVEYIAAHIVRSCNASQDDSEKHCSVHYRTSAVRAQEISGRNYWQDAFNSGAELRYSEERFSIDEFVAQHGLGSVDFIKTDVDGHDYSVLLGAKKTLESAGVLGVAVEVNFNAGPHPEANLLSSNDAYLRSLGFRIFDIDVRRYTRAALPGKFRYKIPAQTTQGQVVQADVIYLRDFVEASFSRDRSPVQLTLPRLLKMVALFEIFGLNDCAVELINAYADDFKPAFDIEQLISVLSEEFCGTPDYGEYMRRFEHYMKERRYDEFPDGYAVQGEGFVLRSHNDPASMTFRQR